MSDFSRICSVVFIVVMHKHTKFTIAPVYMIFWYLKFYVKGVKRI